MSMIYTIYVNTVDGLIYPSLYGRGLSVFSTKKPTVSGLNTTIRR
jgi:hypothetical protein